MAKVDPSLIYILNKTNNKYVPVSITTTADKVLYDLENSITLKDKMMLLEEAVTKNLESNLKPYGGDKMNFLKDYNGDGDVYINKNNTLNKVTKYHLLDGKQGYSDLKVKKLEAENVMSTDDLATRYYTKEEVDTKDRNIVDGTVANSKTSEALVDNFKNKITTYSSNVPSVFPIKPTGSDTFPGYMNVEGFKAGTTQAQPIVTAMSLGLYCKDAESPMELKSIVGPERPQFILGTGGNFKDGMKIYPLSNVTVSKADTASTAENSKNADNAKKYKGQDIDDVITKVRSVDLTKVARVKIGTESPTTATIDNGEIYIQLY
jgi:hypothetical protein